MFKNYIKSALHSLWRRKWVSLFTLFSVALALVVVSCGASLWNMWTAPIAPEVYKERTFFMDGKAFLKKDGRAVHKMNGAAALPHSFYQKEVYAFNTPELAAVFENRGILEFFRNNKSRKVDLMRTDHNFFKVFDFEFVAGKPFAENDNQAPVAHCVISEEMAAYYFGKNDCIGEILANRANRYKVVGVVKKPVNSTHIKADIYRQMKASFTPNYVTWSEVAFLCSSADDKTQLDIELASFSRKCNEQSKNQNIELYSSTSLMLYLSDHFDYDPEMIVIYIVLGLIVLIIPGLCLVDVLRNNQSVHSQEIGIHRAFGASRKRMIEMLLVDNLVVTVFGGILGLVISFLFFVFMSEDSWPKILSLFFHWRAFFYYLFVFLIIGALSGILPAIRMSKLDIVNAINDSEND